MTFCTQSDRQEVLQIRCGIGNSNSDLLGNGCRQAKLKQTAWTVNSSRKNTNICTKLLHSIQIDTNTIIDPFVTSFSAINTRD